MAEAAKLTAAEVAKLGPDARRQIERATGSSSSSSSKKKPASSSDKKKKPSSSSSSSDKKKKKKPSRSSAPRRRPGRAHRMGKQMAREAVGAPARRAGAVVARLFAYGLALTLLYVALAHPDVIRAAARAPGIALRWMSNPSASIPYAL